MGAQACLRDPRVLDGVFFTGSRLSRQQRNAQETGISGGGVIVLLYAVCGKLRHLLSRGLVDFFSLSCEVITAGIRGLLARAASINCISGVCFLRSFELLR